LGKYLEDNKVLIFDFDGVLIDSVHEVALTAYNAQYETSIRLLEELSSSYIHNFISNRHVVQSTGDFLELARYCLESSKRNERVSLTLNKFQAILKDCKQDLAKRREKFFAARAHFINESKECWLKLHKPFQPIWDKISKSKRKLIIVTNKNQSAVNELCNYFGLCVLPQNLYSGDTGVKKALHLGAISERFPNKELYFIDDSIHNLCELLYLREKFKLKLILASWGYCGPEAYELAIRSGIEIYNQDEIIDFIEHIY
jgi:FMN phosphatase YigB (HAD superfamily)